MTSGIFSYVCWASVRPLWRSVYSGPRSIFNWIVWFFSVESYGCFINFGWASVSGLLNSRRPERGSAGRPLAQGWRRSLLCRVRGGHWWKEEEGRAAAISPAELVPEVVFCLPSPPTSECCVFQPKHKTWREKDFVAGSVFSAVEHLPAWRSITRLFSLSFFFKLCKDDHLPFFMSVFASALLLTFSRDQVFFAFFFFA